MIERYCEGKVPQPGQITAQEKDLETTGRELAGKVESALADCKFHTALEAILGLAMAANRYIDTTEPFKLAKRSDAASRERLETVLYHCAEAVRMLSVFLGPFMPSSMEKVWEQICWEQADKMLLGESGKWGVLPAGTVVRKGASLFPRTDKK